MFFKEETKSKFDTENLKKPMSISNPSLNKFANNSSRANKKMPSSTCNPTGLNKIIKSRALNAISLKAARPFKNAATSRTNFVIKPILKQTKSLESFKNASIQKPLAQPKSLK